jgi:tetratricopeptide (TPR) repeat protein
MSGEFNIAVAIFTDQQGRASAYGEDVAKVFSNRLKTELNDFAQQSKMVRVIELLEPNITGSIKGNSPLARQENALSLAKNIGAHMVVFGTIDESGKDIYISPQFVISYQFITDAEELLGEYRFGTPILITDSVDSFQDRLSFNRELSDRTNALASITIGLINYFSGNFDDALGYFTVSDSYETWDENEGKEVIKILLGNANIKLDRFDEAIDYYQQAIQINPEYSRGYIGLATAEFRKAISDPRQIEYALIYNAVSNFNQAILASDQPSKSLVDLKSYFGLGEAMLLLTQTGRENQLDDARLSFLEVISLFNEFDEEEVIKQIVWERFAQSNAHLGLIAYIQKLSMGEVEEYYQEAANAAIKYGDPDLAALYWMKLSSLYEEQDIFSRAIWAVDNGLEVVVTKEIQEELLDRKKELIIKTGEVQ